LLLGGTGSTTFAEDQDIPKIEGNALEVADPVATIIPKGEALRGRMLEIFHTSKRKACIFHLIPADDALPIGEARAGGLPDLPAHMSWPRTREGQLPFLVQLPLDPAREAGILPIEATPGALLTIFGVWNPELAWTSPGPAFVIPVTANLTRGIAEDESAVLPWYRVRSEIVEEYPSWDDLVVALTSCVGPINRKDLAAFRKEEWERLPHPHEGVKIGGWPAWIQSPSSNDPFLAQIAANDSPEISLVDEGSLFVFVSPSGGLEVFLQYS
jgi:hypothetical protein